MRFLRKVSSQQPLRPLHARLMCLVLVRMAEDILKRQKEWICHRFVGKPVGAVEMWGLWGWFDAKWKEYYCRRMVCTELSKLRGVEGPVSSNQATIPLIHQILLAKTGPSRRIRQLQSANMSTCPWPKRLCEDAGCLEYGWPGGLRPFLDRWGSLSETPSSHTCRIERSGSAVLR